MTHRPTLPYFQQFNLFYNTTKKNCEQQEHNKPLGDTANSPQSMPCVQSFKIPQK
jgi:hypothetical protein